MKPKNKSTDDLDLGNFDEMFSSLEDTNFCAPELINPSKPDWEIILHFDDQNPEIKGTPAHEDMKLITNLTNFGYACVSYTRATRTVVISPLKDCCEDQFEEDILEILKKYRLMAKAPPESRRKEQTTEILPVTNPASANPEITATVYSIARAMAVVQPAIKGIIGFDSEECEKIYQFDFEELVCTIPASDPGLLDKLDKLQKLAEEEELDLVTDEQGGEYAVILSKLSQVTYTKTMNPENVIFLERMGAKPI